MARRLRQQSGVVHGGNRDRRDGCVALRAGLGRSNPAEAREERRRRGRDALADSGRDMLDRGREMYERGRKLADEAAEMFERGRKIVESTASNLKG